MDNGIKLALSTELLLLAGLALLGPILLPAAARLTRPAAKAFVKVGMDIYREAVADLEAEVAEEAGAALEEAAAAVL